MELGRTLAQLVEQAMFTLALLDTNAVDTVKTSVLQENMQQQEAAAAAAAQQENILPKQEKVVAHHVGLDHTKVQLVEQVAVRALAEDIQALVQVAVHTAGQDHILVQVRPVVRRAHVENIQVLAHAAVQHVLQDNTQVLEQTNVTGAQEVLFQVLVRAVVQHALQVHTKLQRLPAPVQHVLAININQALVKTVV